MASFGDTEQMGPGVSTHWQAAGLLSQNSPGRDRQMAASKDQGYWHWSITCLRQGRHCRGLEHHTVGVSSSSQSPSAIPGYTTWVERLHQDSGH